MAPPRQGAHGVRCQHVLGHIPAGHEAHAWGGARRYPPLERLRDGSIASACALLRSCPGDRTEGLASKIFKVR